MSRISTTSNQKESPEGLGAQVAGGGAGLVPFNVFFTSFEV
jgi:hypothetical protein